MSIHDLISVTTVCHGPGSTASDMRIAPHIAEAMGVSGQRKATWEGSVLPALRAALDAHPETRGAAVVTTDGASEAFQVRAYGPRFGGCWFFAGHVSRESAAAMMDDVAAFASGAAIESNRMAERQTKPTDCPVCQAIAGWAPSCTQCRSGGSATYDPAKVRVSFAGVECVPMPAEDAELSIGYVSDRAKAPEGYTFRVCKGVNDAPWVHVMREDRADAFRYGRNYESSTDAGYGSAGHWTAATNDDARYWEGHEAARQYAAHLLGEVAPPLRGAEPAAPDQPEGYTFSRVSATEVAVCTGGVPADKVWCHVFADDTEPRPGLWIARPEHRSAFFWARSMLTATELAAKPWQPQVGDRVVLESWMGKVAGLAMLEEMAKSANREAVIANVDTDGTAWVDLPNGDGWWWPVSAMRPANMADPRCQTGDSGHSSKTDSPSQAIGVGSRVVLPRLAEVDGTPGFVPAMRVLCGREGVVDDVDGHRMAVRVDGGWAWLWPTALLRPA